VSKNDENFNDFDAESEKAVKKPHHSDSDDSSLEKLGRLVSSFSFHISRNI